MAEESSCKREFSGLAEDKRPPYLIKVGTKVNAAGTLFEDIGYTGDEIIARGIALLTKLAVKDLSKDNQDVYDLELKDCDTMMDKVYDGVDFVAQGDPAIIEKAGITPTSSNHSSIGNPSAPADLKFVVINEVGQMQLTRDTDKLAWGSVTVSFTNAAATAVKSGNSQLKLTAPDGTVFFIDIESTLKTTIQNLSEGDKLRAVQALFNANGLSPVASPAPIVVPR